MAIVLEMQEPMDDCWLYFISAHPTSEYAVAFVVDVKLSKTVLRSGAVFTNAERHSKLYNILGKSASANL